MSKPSKNIPMPISHMMRRWNDEMGRRSRRAPALAVASRSLPPIQPGQTVDGQGFCSQAAVLLERVLLGRLKKLLAPPRGAWVELKNAVDQGIRLRGQGLAPANLRDKSGLHRELG